MPDPPAAPAEDVDARQLLQNLLAQGWTKTETARQLGRSRRLLDFILAGQKPGINLRQGLHELGQHGQVRTPPTRRLASTGTPARVRGRQGQPSVVPTAPPTAGRAAGTRTAATRAPGTRPPGTRRRGPRPSRSTDQPEFTQRPLEGRNTLNHEQQVLGPNGEREFHRIQVPKAHQAWNRELGREIVTDIVERARGRLKRMQFTVWVEIGTGASKQRRAVRLGGKGGYDAGDVRRGIRVEGDDPFAWLATQVEDRYPELTEDTWTVVSVDLDVW